MIREIFAIIKNKKFYPKLNFIRIIGRFQKYAKTNIADTSRLSGSIDSQKPYCSPRL